MTKRMGRIGSSFEDYLAEQGNLKETSAIAVKRVLAWQLEQAMEERQMSKSPWLKRCGQVGASWTGFWTRITTTSAWTPSPRPRTSLVSICGLSWSASLGGDWACSTQADLPSLPAEPQGSAHR